MRLFTATELERMRGTQEGAMQDTCVVLAYSSASTDALGNPSPTYTAGSAQACGYKPNTTKEAHEDGEVVQLDAVLRMAHDASVNAHDRIRITHRFGEALASPLLFEVVGQPALGPSGLVVDLRKVTSE